jgi:anti-sigma-K factor RskA
MPGSKADAKALIELSQAFRDHVKDEERRFDDITTAIKGLSPIIPTLARVEEQIRQNGDMVGELVKRVGLQNGRIGKLERWRSWMLGVLLVVGGLAGYVIEHILKIQ